MLANTALLNRKKGMSIYEHMDYKMNKCKRLKIVVSTRFFLYSYVEICENHNKMR